MGIPDWVVGHTAECDLNQERMDLLECTCGYTDLKVHASPARAGGVLCIVRDGWPCVETDTYTSGWRNLSMSEKTPIREAWERLRERAAKGEGE